MDAQDDPSVIEALDPMLDGVRKKRMLNAELMTKDNDDDDFGDFPMESQGARTRPRNEGEDQDEEGEEEEDDDDDDEDDDDDDALKRMGLSKEERRRLMKMPELERELELTRRTAADEDAVFMKQLARSGRAQKDVSLPEDRDVRRSERKQASAQRPNSKLESLKEMKASRARQEQKQVEDDHELSLRVSSDEGEVEEMDVQPKLRVHHVTPEDDEEGNGQVKERGASNEPNDDEIDDEDEGVESEAGQDEVIKMQVRRDNLEDWIKHPHLQQTLKGAVVRVAGGNSGRSMWIIDDVVDGDSYQFGSAQRLFSDKHLRIQSPAGDRVETVPFSVVSNCEMSMDEYHVFHGDRAKAKVPQITKHEAAAVQAQLQFARDYTLSAEDINRIVRDRKAKGLVKKPLSVQRAELILERQAAEERGDEAALQRVSEKLAEVLHKMKLKQQEQAEDDRFDMQLAELDKKAAMANRSRGSSKGDRGQGAVMKDDPYSRKRTVEKVYWSTGQKSPHSSTDQEQTRVEEAQEEDLSRLDQLLSWHLPAPALPLREAAFVARRVLGKIGRYSPAENIHGKTVVSLDTYVDMVHKTNFSEMGLD